MSGRLVYLSGAPRVATHPGAETSGARAHILGMTGAFERLGWSVERFIVGDRVPRAWSGSGSQRAASRTLARRLAADLLRLVLGRVNAYRAARLYRGRADLVYERFGAFQALGDACRTRGVPWVLETNGPLFYEASVERRSLVLRRLARALERRAYRRCDLLVCVSDALKTILVESCGVSAEKVLVVPNGVDVDFFDPAHWERVRCFDGFTVGFAGNLYPWAGVDLLLDAVAALRREGCPVHAVVVGDGMEREALEARVRRAGIADAVAFTGRVPRAAVPSYLAGFDLGYSGQVAMQIGAMYHSPLKLYEYLAMGTPPVCSAFADARRAVRDGVTGFLFTPGDAADLAAAIRRAYDARARLPDMGRAARADAVAHHGWVARAQLLLEHLGRLDAPPLAAPRAGARDEVPARERSAQAEVLAP